MYLSFFSINVSNFLLFSPFLFIYGFSLSVQCFFNNPLADKNVLSKLGSCFEGLSSSTMSYREVVPGIYNVGCLDPILREFHVHEIGRGTSYNSFLIKDKQICIIDTVKENFCHEFVQNIKACLAGKQGEEPDDSILQQYVISSPSFFFTILRVE